VSSLRSFQTARHEARTDGADLVGGGGAAGGDAAQHEVVRGDGEGVELRGDVRRGVDRRQQREGRGGATEARVGPGELDQRLVVGVGVEEVAARAGVRRVRGVGEGGADSWRRRWGTATRRSSASLSEFHCACCYLSRGGGDEGRVRATAKGAQLTV
jgi:hypothetical protein